MMRSLFSGVSGLATNMVRMDVIGNNVANVNTVGYKASRVTFEETMSQLLRGATAPLGTRGGANATQIGTGAKLGTVDGIFTQGSMESTGVDTDLAIQGRAFFILSDGASQYYSRAGSFQLDGTGRLVNPSNGFALQGFAYDRVNDTYASMPSTLKLPLGEVVPPKATTVISFRGNLDADSEPRGMRAQSGVLYGIGVPATGADLLDNLKADATGVVDLLSPADVISFNAIVNGVAVNDTLTVDGGSTLDGLLEKIQTTLNSVDGVSGITVVMGPDGRIQVASPDGLGKKGGVSGLVIQAQDADGVPRGNFNALTVITETQSARDAATMVNENTIYDSMGFSHLVRIEFTRTLGMKQFTWRATVDGGSTPILSGGSGRADFNNDGSINGLFYDPVGGAIPTALSVSPDNGAAAPMTILLDPGTSGGFAGMTLMQSASTLEAGNDGYNKGTAVDFRVDRNGTVTGIFSNGVTRPVARVALAEFVNPTGLVRYGDNLYQASVNSGDALVGSIGGSVEATVLSGSLEQSNVDLSREFTNMILAQRGFQASARMITTSDEVLTELLNMKR